MSDDPGERLAKWLDAPGAHFTRREIIALSKLLEEREADTEAVRTLVQSVYEFVLPAVVDRNISALYTRFYERIVRRNTEI